MCLCLFCARKVTKLSICPGKRSFESSEAEAFFFKSGVRAGIFGCTNTSRMQVFSRPSSQTSR